MSSDSFKKGYPMKGVTERCHLTKNTFNFRVDDDANTKFPSHELKVFPLMGKIIFVKLFVKLLIEFVTINLLPSTSHRIKQVLLVWN